MRGELYKITELHTQHTPVGVARHSTLKSYYDEQQDLWREQVIFVLLRSLEFVHIYQFIESLDSIILASYIDYLCRKSSLN